MAANFAAPAEEDYMDDDLFDYDADIPDIDTTIKESTPEKKKQDTKKDTLGLDEEVKIRKKRITVKLDEARLLREDIGIPKLRKEAPKKLKFRGKGYEYRDAARLLSYYQLWADDLYKKAKFRDTLQIIEKLGHSRAMRDHRAGWIEESKNKKRKEREGAQEASQDLERRQDREGESAQAESAGPDDQIPHEDDVFYARLPMKPVASGSQGAGSSGPLFLGADGGSSEDDFGPPDDEFDLLMERAAAASTAGEETSLTGKGKEIIRGTATVDASPWDDFADEMEVMAEFAEDF